MMKKSSSGSGPNPHRALLLFLLAIACLPLHAQTASLALTGLRTIANQGQFNAIQSDAAGNLYLLLDQHDGIRLLKTDPTATTILAQTHLGSQGDIALSLALDPTGNPYITGTTTSGSLSATAGAAFPTPTGTATNSFIAKLDPNLNLLFLTFAGSGKLRSNILHRSHHQRRLHHRQYLLCHPPCHSLRNPSNPRDRHRPEWLRRKVQRHRNHPPLRHLPHRSHRQHRPICSHRRLHRQRLHHRLHLSLRLPHPRRPRPQHHPSHPQRHLGLPNQTHPRRRRNHLLHLHPRIRANLHRPRPRLPNPPSHRLRLPRPIPHHRRDDPANPHHLPNSPTAPTRRQRSPRLNPPRPRHPIRCHPRPQRHSLGRRNPNPPATPDPIPIHHRQHLHRPRHCCKHNRSNRPLRRPTHLQTHFRRRPRKPNLPHHRRHRPTHLRWLHHPAIQRQPPRDRNLRRPPLQHPHPRPTIHPPRRRPHPSLLLWKPLSRLSRLPHPPNQHRRTKPGPLLRCSSQPNPP